MRGEDDPGEQAAPAHRPERRIDGGVLGIVAIVDAAHRRRAEEGGEEQQRAGDPSDLQLSLGEGDIICFRCIFCIRFVRPDEDGV